MLVSLIPMIIILVLFFVMLKIKNNESSCSSNSVSYKNNSQKRSEIEFRCNMCGATWYATKKDVSDAKRMKSSIRVAELNSMTLSSKKHTFYKGQAAQMQTALNDPLQCKHCGSRNVAQNL